MFYIALDVLSKVWVAIAFPLELHLEWIFPWKLYFPENWILHFGFIWLWMYNCRHCKAHNCFNVFSFLIYECNCFTTEIASREDAIASLCDCIDLTRVHFDNTFLEKDFYNGCVYNNIYVFIEEYWISPQKWEYTVYMSVFAIAFLGFWFFVYLLLFRFS